MTKKLGYSIAIEFWRRNSAAMDELYTDDPANDEDIPKGLRDIYEENGELIDRIMNCAEQDAEDFFAAAKSEIERTAKACGLAAKKRRSQSTFWLGGVYIARRGRWSGRTALELGVAIETAAEDGEFDVAVYLAFPRDFRVTPELMLEIEREFPQACLDGVTEVSIRGSICLATLKLSNFVDAGRSATDLDALLQKVVSVLQQVQDCGLLPWALLQRDGKPGQLKMSRLASAGK